MCTVNSSGRTRTLEGCDNYGSDVTLDIPPGGLYTGSSDCIVDEAEVKEQRDCCSATGDWLKDSAANVFRKKTLYKRMPILEWLPKYDRNDFVGDLVAGITVGLTVIPQGLAFAGITGLELQVSIWTPVLRRLFLK
uniref:Sodium-independent sulfate anion transporter n=1 Tax=Bactrocera latifrons TaxID=174628 RepID=A0A0K8W3X7_BACLA